jgi:HPt (histidine-containing phosphotransfer) domain-containing protein
MSAEISPSITSRLTAMGIDCILAKPMSISAIHHAVLQQIECVSQPAIWDDKKALAVLGNNAESLKSLKSLFNAELPLMMQQIDVEFSNDNHPKITDILHKLKASCGFLGANKLLAECNALEQNICRQSITQFMLVAKQTLETI